MQRSDYRLPTYQRDYTLRCPQADPGASTTLHPHGTTKTIEVDNKLVTVLQRKLGDGDFGTVYEGRMMDAGIEHRVAVKYFKLTGTQAGDFWKEMRTLSALNYKHIIKCMGYNEKERVLVMEFAEGGSLKDMIEARYSNISLKEKYAIARDIAYGLLFMHWSNFIHNDVHVGNILFNSEGRAMLGDLGISYHKTSRMKMSHNYNGVSRKDLELPEGFSSRVDSIGFAGVLLAIFTGDIRPTKHFVDHPTDLPHSQLADFPWLEQLIDRSIQYLQLKGKSKFQIVPDIASLLVVLEQNFPYDDYFWDIESLQDLEGYHPDDPELASLIWRMDKQLLVDVNIRKELVKLALCDTAQFEVRQAAKKKLVSSNRLTDTELLPHFVHVFTNKLTKFDSYTMDLLGATDKGRETARFYVRFAQLRSRIGPPHVRHSSLLKRMFLYLKASFEAANLKVEPDDSDPYYGQPTHGELVEFACNTSAIVLNTTIQDFLHTIGLIVDQVFSGENITQRIRQEGYHNFVAKLMPHMNTSINKYTLELTRRIFASPINLSDRSYTIRDLQNVLKSRTLHTEITMLTVLDELPYYAATGGMAKPFKTIWGIINDPDESETIRCAALKSACRIATQRKYKALFKQYCQKIPNVTATLSDTRKDVLAEL